MAQMRKYPMGKPLNNLQGFRFGRIRAGWTMEKAMQPLAWLAEGNTPEEA